MQQAVKDASRSASQSIPARTIKAASPDLVQKQPKPAVLLHGDADAKPIRPSSSEPLQRRNKRSNAGNPRASRSHATPQPSTTAAKSPEQKAQSRHRRSNSRSSSSNEHKSRKSHTGTEGSSPSVADAPGRNALDNKASGLDLAGDTHQAEDVLRAGSSCKQQVADSSTPGDETAANAMHDGVRFGESDAQDKLSVPTLQACESTIEEAASAAALSHPPGSRTEADDGIPAMPQRAAHQRQPRELQGLMPFAWDRYGAHCACHMAE